MAHPAIGQDDVGIQDLTRIGIHTAGTNRGPHIVIQPAHEVVTHIFRVEVHVTARRCILVMDFNRFPDTNFFKRFVPGQNSLFDPIPITGRRGVFNVKRNRFLGRAKRQLGISLLQVPAVDETCPHVFIFVFAQITVTGGKITNPFVCFTGAVARRSTNRTDRVVQCRQLTITGWHFEGDFDILRERLRLGDRKDARRQSTTYRTAKETTRASHEQLIQINDRTSFGSDARDRNRKQHSVSKDPLDGRFGFGFTGRPHFQLRRDQCQRLIVPPPVDKHLAVLQTREQIARRDRQGDVIPL